MKNIDTNMVRNIIERGIELVMKRKKRGKVDEPNRIKKNSLLFTTSQISHRQIQGD